MICPQKYGNKNKKSLEQVLWNSVLNKNPQLRVEEWSYYKEIRES